MPERKRARFELEGQKEFAEKIFDAARDALLVLGWDLRVKAANETFYRIEGAAPGTYCSGILQSTFTAGRSPGQGRR